MKLIYQITRYRTRNFIIKLCLHESSHKAIIVQKLVLVKSNMYFTTLQASTVYNDTINIANLFTVAVITYLQVWFSSI